jgi:glycosyltransferase involved in cell wall biosynthesis
MKILFLSRILPHPLGSSGSVIVYRRMRFLVERGHEVGLLSLATEPERARAGDLRPLLAEMELVPAAENAAAAPLWRRCLSRAPHPFCLAWHPAVPARLADLVERSRYQVVIAEFTTMGQYLFRNPLLPAVRRVVSCHESPVSYYRKSIQLQPWSAASMFKRLNLHRLKHFEFGLYRAADHVLVLTPQDRHALLAGASDLRVTVVPHTVDTDYFAQAPGLAAPENALVFVGCYSLESNRDAVRWFARTVWPDLRRRFPDLVFYVVGREATPDILELGRRDPRLIVTGEVADVRPYLGRARVFLCPVRMGSGLRPKILEAMAAGVPVVSTSLGAEGIPAWSGDSLLIADTPDQFRRSVGLLLTDPGLRRVLADAARRMVAARFALSHGSDTLDRVVHDVVSADE